jgi:hypothetical protein
MLLVDESGVRALQIRQGTIIVSIEKIRVYTSLKAVGPLTTVGMSRRDTRLIWIVVMTAALSA